MVDGGGCDGVVTFEACQLQGERGQGAMVEVTRLRWWVADVGSPSPILTGFGRVTPVLTGLNACPIHHVARTGHTTDSRSDRFDRPVRSGF
ncbi:hypothetical protein MTR_1g064160 [Medicago truncatula]|uniref:Uncharacterized protein n=1 Tax=Medicago truncatula TaxID=3880 RepID=G7IBI7_MEDTR|nr:hypothetical protein MTR_1g064160 [Medicago truncatula]